MRAKLDCPQCERTFRTQEEYTRHACAHAREPYARKIQELVEREAELIAALRPFAKRGCETCRGDEFCPTCAARAVLAKYSNTHTGD